ncbi:MAG TPA: rhamnogalacturonan acetylesterase [Polyangiaceae bacterium]
MKQQRSVEARHQNFELSGHAWLLAFALAGLTACGSSTPSGGGSTEAGGGGASTGGTIDNGSGGKTEIDAATGGSGGVAGTGGTVDVGGAGGVAGTGGSGGSGGTSRDASANDGAAGQRGTGGASGGSDAAARLDAAADAARVEAGAPRVDAGSTSPPVGPNPTTATRMICTGADPISCHFGGQPGNYDVTVVLGGTAPANTLVQTETLRTMLGPTATDVGQTQRFSFTVNVRQPEGQPIEDVPAGTPGLDLYFLGNGGAAPALTSIGFASAASPFMIYLAGDSTVCDQPTTDYGGWGQQLPQFFNYPVSIANYADTGESSGSFLNSGSLFGAISSRLKANDWVFIQFGHNDKSTTAADFHDNMTALVAGVKAKGAFPILVTPVARATFSGSTLTAQHINSVGANLPVIVQQVATEQNVPMIDLLARTITWLNQLGPNGWQQYHALGTDMTHTNPAGALVEAGFVVDLLKQANLTTLTSKLR